VQCNRYLPTCSRQFYPKDRSTKSLRGFGKITPDYHVISRKTEICGVTAIGTSNFKSQKLICYTSMTELQPLFFFFFFPPSPITQERVHHRYVFVYLEKCGLTVRVIMGKLCSELRCQALCQFLLRFLSFQCQLHRYSGAACPTLIMSVRCLKYISYGTLSSIRYSE
jgi:hypothetical protein